MKDKYVFLENRKCGIYRDAGYVSIDEVFEYFKDKLNEEQEKMFSETDKRMRDNYDSMDEFYFDYCGVIAQNSICLSRKIGAVLIKGNEVLSTGYNGPPKGLPSCDCRYEFDKKLDDEYNKLDIVPEDRQQICPRYALGYKSGEGLDLCVAVHAERACLINAAKRGVSTNGATMYMDCAIPCTPCLVEIINAGVAEIVVTQESYYDRSAEYVLKNSGLKWRTYGKTKK